MSSLAGTISFFWASRFLTSLSRIEESCSSDGSGSRASFLRYLCDLLLTILSVLLLLNVESKLHYVAVFDDILFAFDTQFSGFTSLGE
jgi:hypothetical protein